MTTGTVTVRNGDAGPDYDVLVDTATIDGVLGKLGYTVAMDRVPTRIAVTPVINTSIYAANDQVGGLMTFTGAAAEAGRGGRVVGATITDRAKVKANLQMWLFQVSPTLAGSNNNPFDITDANLEAAQLIGHIDFLTANYRDTASNSACNGAIVGTPDGGLRFSSSGAGGALFGAMVCTATPTYVSASDLVVSLFTVQS